MTKFANIKKGEKLSETQYYSVSKIQGDKVELETATGESVVVDNTYVEQFLTSASQFEKEETLNRTDAANLLTANTEVVLTVNFNKQVDEKEVIKETVNELKMSTIDQFEKAVAKAIKRTIKGEARTMVGRHSGNINEFGRLQFIDMEATSHNLRQVDPRGINWMIIKGTKYTVK